MFCDVVQLAHEPNKHLLGFYPSDVVFEVRLRIHVLLDCVKHGINPFIYVCPVHICSPLPASNVQ